MMAIIMYDHFDDTDYLTESHDGRCGLMMVVMGHER